MKRTHSSDSQLSQSGDDTHDSDSNTNNQGNRPPHKRQKRNNHSNTNNSVNSNGNNSNKCNDNDKIKGRWVWGVDEREHKKRTRAPDAIRSSQLIVNKPILYKRKSEYIVSQIKEYSKQYAFVKASDHSDGVLRINWKNIYLIKHHKMEYKSLLSDPLMDPVYTRLVHDPDSKGDVYVVPFEADVIDDGHIKVVYAYDDKETEAVTLFDRFRSTEANQSLPSMIPALCIIHCTIYQQAILNNKSLLSSRHFDIFPDSSDVEEDDDVMVLNSAQREKKIESTPSKKKKRKQLDLKSYGFETPQKKTQKKTTQTTRSRNRKQVTPNGNKATPSSSSKKELSQEAIAALENGFEVRGFKIKILNGKKWIWIPDNGKSGTWCSMRRNHYLFTQTAINKFYENYHYYKQLSDGKFCCEACNGWHSIKLKEGVDITIGAYARDKSITLGFELTDPVFASDRMKAHESNKYHKLNKDNLTANVSKQLDQCWNKIKAAGDISPKLMDYIPVFYTVYFGVRHHYSLNSMISLKSDLLQLVVNYFVDKIKTKVSKQADKAFKRIQKVISDENGSKAVRECVDKQAKRLNEYIGSLEAHKISTKYKNTRDVKAMIAALADIIRGDTWQQMVESPINSLLCDESTSLGQTQRMIIYYIYLKNADKTPEAVASFIDIIECAGGANETELFLLIKQVMVKINNFIKKFKAEECEEKRGSAEEKAVDIINGKDITKCTINKTVFFGSDGAGVMKKLGDEMKVLNTVIDWIHCIAHRGALASKDPQKTQSLKGIMDDIDKEVGEIQAMIKNSPKLKMNLNAYIETLDKLVSKLHFKIRWLSKCNAYENHLSHVPAIINCFTREHSEESDTKRRSKMKGAAQKLQNFDRLHKKAIITDVLSAIQPLKRQFQPDIMEFDRIDDVLNDTCEDLKHLKENKGTYESQVLNMVDVREYENKEEQNKIEALWDKSAICVRTRGMKQNSDKNVFLKRAQGKDIPIYKYSSHTFKKNKAFKTELANGTADALSNRYENMKGFSFMSIFNPKCVDKFISEHQMPQKVEKGGKNVIVNWYITEGFATKQIKEAFDRYVDYYKGLDVGVNRQIELEWKQIETHQIREYIWILHRNKGKVTNKKRFWMQRWRDLKKKCFAIALMGRHHLIAPWNTGICERGFSEQNMNITKMRVKIETPLLRDLMMIVLNGPSTGTEEFHSVIVRALKRWSINKRY